MKLVRPVVVTYCCVTWRHYDAVSGDVADSLLCWTEVRQRR